MPCELAAAAFVRGAGHSTATEPWKAAVQPTTRLGITRPSAHRHLFLPITSTSPPDAAHRRRYLAMSTHSQEHASGRKESEYSSSLRRDFLPTHDPHFRRFLAVAPSSAEMGWRREGGAYSNWSTTFHPDIYLGNTRRLKKSRLQRCCGKKNPPPPETLLSFGSWVLNLSKKLAMELVRMAGSLLKYIEHISRRPEMDRVRLEIKKMKSVLRATALKICRAIVLATNDSGPPPPPEPRLAVLSEISKKLVRMAGFLAKICSISIDIHITFHVESVTTERLSTTQPLTEHPSKAEPPSRTVPSTTQPPSTTKSPATTQRPSKTEPPSTTVPSSTQSPSSTTKSPATTERPSKTQRPSKTEPPSTTVPSTTQPPSSTTKSPVSATGSKSNRQAQHSPDSTGSESNQQAQQTSNSMSSQPSPKMQQPLSLWSKAVRKVKKAVNKRARKLERLIMMQTMRSLHEEMKRISIIQVKCLLVFTVCFWAPEIVVVCQLLAVECMKAILNYNLREKVLLACAVVCDNGLRVVEACKEAEKVYKLSDKLLLVWVKVQEACKEVERYKLSELASKVQESGKVAENIAITLGHMESVYKVLNKGVKKWRRV